MENNYQQQIDSLEAQLNELRQKVSKNDFSNLYVFDTPVKFKRPNVYKVDATGIASGTSAGRIAITLEDGTTKYIPYF